MRLDGHGVDILAYMDDVDFIAESFAQVSTLTEEFRETAERVGLLTIN